MKRTKVPIKNRITRKHVEQDGSELASLGNYIFSLTCDLKFHFIESFRRFFFFFFFLAVVQPNIQLNKSFESFSSSQRNREIFFLVRLLSMQWKNHPFLFFLSFQIEII